MTDLPPRTTEPAEPSPRGHAFFRVRAVLLVAALVVLWVGVVSWWTLDDSSSGGLFDAGRVAVTAVLAVITGLWCASIRFGALRRALLPFEAGFVVAAIVMAAGQRGIEVDENGDAAFIAVMVGIATALVVTFVAQLLAGRRSAPGWIVGVMTIATLLGVALPALADRWSTPDGLEQLTSAPTSSRGIALAQLTDDGWALLGSGYEGAATASLDPSLGAMPGVAVDPTSPPGVALPPAPAPIDAAATSGTRRPILLVADEAGRLQLRLPPHVAPDGTALEVELHRGACDPTGLLVGAPKPAAAVWRGSAVEGEVTRLAISTLTLDDVAIGDRLYVLLGTGEPLARVRCADLVATLPLALARNGGTEFSAQCIRPLDLSSGERTELTPAAFERRDCAQGLRRLGRLVSSALLADAEVPAIVRCLDAAGVRHDVDDLEGGSSVRLLDDADVASQDSAIACFVRGSGTSSLPGAVDTSRPPSAVDGGTPPDSPAEGGPVDDAALAPPVPAE